ncbi:MAG: helix-turn-helix domain-containing protein [Lachnospiraceae bacterium]|nr:helix-turn-helix domain-containing protein [Lachnospiraceae bacterium]
MQINEVIRKYRKEKNMTQEEMANKLGVSAPAVNKWESGASMPDITLLAPIARLLGISLDELLSFKDNLSDIEISNIINDIYAMFNTESLDTVFQKMKDIVKEYPNAEALTLSLASILYGRSLFFAEDRSKYEDWIISCFENLLRSEDANIKRHAADALYGFYISKENYDEAENCLRFFPDESPEKKRKLATIYSGKGRYEEAFKAMEEALYAGYQNMSVLFHELFLTASKTGDYKKAEKFIEKESALSELFEMGIYHSNAGRLELALSMKDNEKALEYIELLISHTDTLTDYMKSDLYEHIGFREVDPSLAETMRAKMLAQFAENDMYKGVRESAGWNDFKKKYY